MAIPKTMATALALLLAVASAWAEVKGPTELTVPVGRLASVTLAVDGDEAEYAVLGGDAFGAFREFSPATVYRFQVLGYAPGVGHIVIGAVKAGKLQPLFTVAVRVTGGPPPTPPVPPPVPPGPTPPPVPPAPDPPPIPADGLHVLIVYESADLPTYPAAQVAALYAELVRGYLNSKCAMGPDGKTRQWRIWDANVDATGESQLWRLALNRKRDRLPWVIVSNGKAGYEGPLPADADALLTLLKKYGGE